MLFFEQAVLLYDDSYYTYLTEHPELVDKICSFGECFDNDPSNIACGLHHDAKAIPRHIQDISVRRAIFRLGRWFKGPSDKLLEIRGEGSNGHFLGPGNIPFFDPSQIPTGPDAGPIPKWAKPDSVEAWWQAAKIIVVAEK